MKVTIPVKTGNKCIANGTLGKTIQSILADLKPEAAYFIEETGQRSGIIVVNISDASQIPQITEPWFLAFNALVEIHPAMTPQDLEKSSGAMEEAVKKYA